MKEYPNVLVRDLFNIIHDDRYAWICCWGPPRFGKSTLCLLLGNWIYRDWDKTLDSVVFSLNGLLYKFEKGQPELWPTRNMLHMRIPYLVMDDFGTHCGKAKTQFERSWDLFKGAHDSLGVRLAILVANMVLPSTATAQLTAKYSHELFVYARGRCKYDRVKHQQDYYDFRPRQNKEWLCDFEFEEVPRDVFKQYDEMRCSLADEVLVAIKDVMATTEVDTIVKRIKPIDENLLRLLDQRGPTYGKAILGELGNEGKQALIRLKARGLIVPRRESSNYYRYDMTDLGSSVLAVLDEKNPEVLEFPTK